MILSATMFQTLEARRSELSQDFELLENNRHELNKLEKSDADFDDAKALKKAREKRITLEKQKEQRMRVEANCARLAR